MFLYLSLFIISLLTIPDCTVSSLMPGVNIFCRTVFCVLCKKHTEPWNNNVFVICLQRESDTSSNVKSSIVPEIIDPVFVKTSPKCSFSMSEYERVGLVPLIVEVRIYSFIFASIQTKLVFVFVLVLHEEHRYRFQGTNSASQCSLASSTITLFLLGS